MSCSTQKPPTTSLQTISWENPSRSGVGWCGGEWIKEEINFTLLLKWALLSSNVQIVCSCLSDSQWMHFRLMSFVERDTVFPLSGMKKPTSRVQRLCNRPAKLYAMDSKRWEQVGEEVASQRGENAYQKASFLPRLAYPRRDCHPLSLLDKGSKQQTLVIDSFNHKPGMNECSGLSAHHPGKMLTHSKPWGPPDAFSCTGAARKGTGWAWWRSLFNGREEVEESTRILDKQLNGGCWCRRESSSSSVMFYRDPTFESFLKQNELWVVILPVTN